MGGRITIESHRVVPGGVEEPETVSISIADTGPGISPAFRSRIFDKFFRREHHQAETRPVARGAGIGLYMSRQIVELHGGTISCGPGTYDQGTCIGVTLPAASPAERGSSKRPSHTIRRSEASNVVSTSFPCENGPA